MPAAIQLDRLCKKRFPCFTVKVLENDPNAPAKPTVNVAEGLVEASKPEQLLGKQYSSH